MAKRTHTLGVITRKDAKEIGALYFLTGKPCKRGHVAPRFVSSGTCIECHLIHGRLRYWRNPERDRIRKRKWRENPANKELHTKRVKRWAENNPEKPLQYYKNRRARKRQNGGKCTTMDALNILLGQNGMCAYAKYNFYWCKPAFGHDNVHHMDHIVPLLSGGSNDPHNRQALCLPCNYRKGSKSEELFLRESGVFACSAVA